MIKKRLNKILMVILAVTFVMVCFGGCFSSNEQNDNGDSGSPDSPSVDGGTNQDDDTDLDTALLKDIYADYFTIGGTVSQYSYSEYGGSDGLINHFNSLTLENELKFSSLQATEGVFDFYMADQLLEFASSYNLPVRGHAFVWHEAMPSWMFEDNGGSASKEKVIQRIKTHIDTVASYYGDSMYVWDVVNEVISDGSEQYRQSEFYLTCGLDFVKESFISARESLDSVGATDVKLYYNDYNMIDPVKRAKCIDMLKELIACGIPIDGIGMQAHYNVWSFDKTEFALAIDEFSALGLEVQITEIDFSTYPVYNQGEVYTSSTDELQTLVASCYRSAFEVLRQKSDKVNNVTFWGIADDYTWLNWYGERMDFPLLFDRDHNKKEAYYSVADIKTFAKEDIKVEEFLSYDSSYTIEQENGVASIDYARATSGTQYIDCIVPSSDSKKNIGYINLTLSADKKTAVRINSTLNYYDGLSKEIVDATFYIDENKETYSVAVPSSVAFVELINTISITPAPYLCGSSAKGTLYIDSVTLTANTSESYEQVESFACSDRENNLQSTNGYTNDNSWSGYEIVANASNEIDVSLSGASEWASIIKQFDSFDEDKFTLNINFNNNSNSITNIVFLLRGDVDTYYDLGDYGYWSYYEATLGTYTYSGGGENASVGYDMTSAIEYIKLNASTGYKLVMYIESHPTYISGYDGYGSMSISDVIQV